MIDGPLLPGILRFALPLIISNVLQLTFNAADIIVLGQFSGQTALAAVGATTSLINLITNLFLGLSVGVNVLVANKLGAQRNNEVRDAVHTAILTAGVGGIALLLVGVLFSESFLYWMGTPEDVITQATVYMRIYFVGMPFLMMYNFGSSILRAIGDTRRPLFFLTISGILNVVLNLFFVIVLHMNVAGVALATVMSQGFSAFLTVLCLTRTEGCCKLDLKNLKIHKAPLLQMMRIGLPAGIQGCLFNIANVMIQSSINSFGSIAMSGNTAAGNIEGFLSVSVNAIHHAALNFIGQNHGAHNHKRIDRIIIYCTAIGFVIGFTAGMLVTYFGTTLLGFYTDDSEVIQYGMIRIRYMSQIFFIGGLMDVFCGCIRGMGYSIAPMIISLAGVCGFRILWLYTFFAWTPTLEMLYLSYPISWGLTALAHFTSILIVRRKHLKPG